MTTNVAIITGRFQPLHNGHKYLFERALAWADHLIVLVGDTGGAPDVRNPFTFKEREDMILSVLTAGKLGDTGLSVRPIYDDPYNDQRWYRQAAQIADDVRVTLKASDVQFAVFGHVKDATSHYIKTMARQIEDQLGFECEFRSVELEGGDVRDATQVRELLFARDGQPDWQSLRDMVPFGVFDKLRNMGVARWCAMRAEWEAIEEDQELWFSDGAQKYGKQHVCVDALVVRGEGANRELVLIERNGAVGKGLLALPGGYVEAGERLIDATLRELEEEVGISLFLSHFSRDGTQVGYHTPFDYPWRDNRMRVFTNVMRIDIPAGTTLKAGSDAGRVITIPFNRDGLNLCRRGMYADHYHIVNYFLERSK